MFCEKIFKIGLLKLCGNGFLDSLLYSLSVYNCTIVQLYISTCIAGNLKSHFRRVLRHQFWKFFHRTSCVYVGNSILDVMGWFARITLVWNSLMNTDPNECFYALAYQWLIYKLAYNRNCNCLPSDCFNFFFWFSRKTMVIGKQ